MKNGIFLFLLFLGLNVSAQEYVEMNDRASLQNISDILSKENKFNPVVKRMYYVKDQSLYSSQNERITRNILIDTGNKEIIHFVKKAKKNRKREFIAFAAVPLGIAAAACIRQNQFSNSWVKPAGIAFFAASLSCIIASPIACHKKNTNYKKAVKLYNLHF
jgi:hypothetical protein